MEAVSVGLIIDMFIFIFCIFKLFIISIQSLLILDQVILFAFLSSSLFTDKFELLNLIIFWVALTDEIKAGTVKCELGR